MRPSEQDGELSTIVLGTTRSPGSCTISGHDRVKAWDVQAAKGQTGASSNLDGDPVGQFQVSFYLADDGGNGDGPTDFDRWDEFQRLIESMTNGPTPFALPIYHPDLARNRFTEVSNASVGGMIHDGRGGATVIVKFIEYKPPKKKKTSTAVAKPAGKVARGGSRGGSPAAWAALGASPPEKPDPNADAKRELAGLVEEARKP